MSNGDGFHNCKTPISWKIRSLLIYLTRQPSKYDWITQNLEYWIEYVLREDFTTVDELVEGVSYMAWEDGGSFANVGRFLKDFRDAPHRSEQARSFVTQLCSHVLRWFAIASVEHNPNPKQPDVGGVIASHGGKGFIRAASFVGHLIECGLLSHELVRQHLIKPLADHYYGDRRVFQWHSVRANAIYQLFIAAPGSTLFQGLFDAEDVWVCFETLDAQAGNIQGYDAVMVKVWYITHAKASTESDSEARNFARLMKIGCNGKTRKSKRMPRRLVDAMKKK